MVTVEFDRSNNNSQRPAGGHYSTAHQPHHGSPHLHHLDRPSAHSTPSPPYQYAHLAAQPTTQSMRQTPTSYPSPASYPSPSMTAAYAYPPQQAPQPPSRGSPYAQASAINLPPIRLNPPASQHSQPPQHEGSPLLGSPLPPPMHGYYPHALPPPAVSHAHITSSPIHQPHQQPLRYPLPSVGSQERIMSGGRHKKEIKRRTKTGCLTCRKRRIKCDEGHPTCKNCQKSKRDCLGYDPIFKSQPGPAAIQPAPSGGSAPLPPMSGSPSSYYPMPSVGQTYQTLSTTASSPASSCDLYDYPQIDPALDSATSHPHNSAPPSLPDLQGPYRPDRKRPLDRTSPFSSASDAGTTRTPYTPIPRSATPGQHQDMQGSTAKRIKIDDLLSVGSSQPLSPPTSELATNVSPPSTSVESMMTIFSSRYAPALDIFLEVRWFSDSGLRTLRSDSQLAELMAEVFERLKARGGSYYADEDPLIHKSNKDADLLWAAIRLCYGTRIPVSDNRRDEELGGDRMDDDEGTEAYRRINILENLVSQRSESNPASPRIPPTDKPSPTAKGSQFWFLLEQLATFQATDPDSDAQVHGLLEECRLYVEGKQNRELLHAIAEIRHLHGETSRERSDALKVYVQAIATDRSLPITLLDRRIAGRAMGRWTTPVNDIPFCMPAV